MVSTSWFFYQFYEVIRTNMALPKFFCSVCKSTVKVVTSRPFGYQLHDDHAICLPCIIKHQLRKQVECLIPCPVSNCKKIINVKNIYVLWSGNIKNLNKSPKKVNTASQTQKRRKVPELRGDDDVNDKDPILHVNERPTKEQIKKWTQRLKVFRQAKPKTQRKSKTIQSNVRAEVSKPKSPEKPKSFERLDFLYKSPEKENSDKLKVKDETPIWLKDALRNKRSMRLRNIDVYNDNRVDSTPTMRGLFTGTLLRVLRDREKLVYNPQVGLTMNYEIR